MNEFETTFRIIEDDRKEEFFAKGYKRRYFLPHEIYYIPKCGVDGFELANRMWSISNPNFLWEIILFVLESSIAEFPRELFFDEDVVWHQQHLGKIGQIATANLIVNGEKLYTLEHISDLVQRIHLRKEYRTRINSCFRHWHHMLLNSVLNFAVENSLKYIYSPTADLLVEKYYPKVDRKLFDRIYNRDVTMHFEVDQRNGTWIIDVNKNRHKLVIPKKEGNIVKDDKKTICVFHDIERGLGQAEVDPVIAESAENDALINLHKILNIENQMNVKTTYNVVGFLFDDVSAAIKKDGHCIAFHSYNHQISRQPTTNYNGEEAILAQISEIGYKVTYWANKILKRLLMTPASYQPISKIYRNLVNKVRKILSLPLIINQLAECRRVDYRIKGYRHYQPWNTSEVSDNDLCFYNFEWLVVNEEPFRAKPKLENRIVKIPVYCDDYEMFKQKMPYQSW